jgi:hypothetical protein
MAGKGIHVTRRTFLQGAATGAALTAFGQTPLQTPVAAAQNQPVSLESWTPASSPATSGLIV